MSHSIGIGLQDEMGPSEPVVGLSFLVFDRRVRCRGDPEFSLNGAALVHAAPWPVSPRSLLGTSRPFLLVLPQTWLGLCLSH